IVEVVAAHRLDTAEDVVPAEKIDNPEVQELAKLLAFITDKRRKSLPVLLETFHDAVEKRQEVGLLFELGYLTLDQKAIAEKLYWSICININRMLQRQIGRAHV